MPEQLEDFNDYFILYKQTGKEQYFNEFLYFYEPVLNHHVEQFAKKYHLDENRQDDLKQIFSFLLWEEMQTYNSDIPLLQIMKFKVTKEWHSYVRTCCGNISVNSHNSYLVMRKVAFLFAEYSHELPFDDVIAKISEETHISQKTVRRYVLLSDSFQTMDNIDIHNSENENLLTSLCENICTDLFPKELYSDKELQKVLKDILKTLKPKDKLLVKMTLGINTDNFTVKEKKSFCEVALMIDMTTDGARKRLSKILSDLKQKLLDVFYKL